MNSSSSILADATIKIDLFLIICAFSMIYHFPNGNDSVFFSRLLIAIGCISLGWFRELICCSDWQESVEEEFDVILKENNVVKIDSL